MSEVKVRKCTNCGEEKTETIEFFSWRKDRNLFLTQCRICLAKKERERKNKKRNANKEPQKFSENGIALKKCSVCGKEKEDTIEFFFYRDKSKSLLHKQCKVCIAQQKKEYLENNREKVAEQRHVLYINNRDKNLEEKKKYSENNKEIIAIRNKKYYENNKPSLRKKNNERSKNRKKVDPIYKCMINISSMIGLMLRRQRSSKNGISSKTKLPFNGEELVKYLESQFSVFENLTPDGEIWMNWDNYGKYDPKTWDDNDPSTWTWQIDHIIPQSKLKFDSYDHPNFLKCWSLENLRPLNAKKNLEEGNRR